MRALVCHAYGPVESLKLEDVPTPVPGAGEVLVKVGAAGVSFAAMLGVQGKHQNKPALPFVPGNEIAGFPPIAMTSDRQSAYESFDRAQAAALRREMELSLAARRQESQGGAARFAKGEGRHGSFERK